MALGIMNVKKGATHLGLRLLADVSVDNYMPDEEARLRDMLLRTRGVERIKAIERHPRGGYTVLLDIELDLTGSILESISLRGFRPVL